MKLNLDPKSVQPKTLFELLENEAEFLKMSVMDNDLICAFYRHRLEQGEGEGEDGQWRFGILLYNYFTH